MNSLGANAMPKMYIGLGYLFYMTRKLGKDPLSSFLKTLVYVLESLPLKKKI